MPSLQRRRSWIIALCCATFLCVIPLHAQTAPRVAPAKGNAQQLLPGVVIEEVEKHSEADKAGLQAADVLLSWSRGDESGKIESPLDVWRLDIEQRSLGRVTLHGLRNSQAKTWTLGPVYWVLDVRPNIRSVLLPSLKTSEKLGDAARQLTAPQPCWLKPWLLMRSAEIWRKARRWQHVDNSYRQAIEASSNCEHRIQAYFVGVLADYLMSRGGLDEAEKHFKKALSLYQKFGPESLIVARWLDRLGRVYQQRADKHLALNYYQQALRIETQLVPSGLETALTLTALSQISADSGDLVAAEAYLAQVRTIEDQLPQDNRWVAASVSTQANAAVYRGDLRQAEINFQRALKIYASSSSSYSEGVPLTLSSLGTVSWLRGDYERAGLYFRRAVLILQRQSQQSLLLSQSLTNLAFALEEKGDLAGAEVQVRHALSLARQFNPEGPEVSICLGHLGFIAQARGHLASAEAYLREMVAADQRVRPGTIYDADGLRDLGDLLLRRNDPLQSKEYLGRAVTILENVSPGSRMHAEALASLAKVVHRMDDPVRSAELYQQALDALDSQSTRLGGSRDISTQFRAQHAGLYSEYIDLLIEQKSSNLALAVVERSRARTLLEMLRFSHVDVRQGTSPALLDLEHSLRAAINAKSESRIRLLSEPHSEESLKRVEKEIADLLSQYQDVESQIRATSPAYAALTQPQPLTAKEIQSQLLDPDTILLEYSLGEERSYVFAVTPGSLEAFTLPKRAVIEKAARRLYRLLTERNHSMQGETAPQKQLRLSKAGAEYSLAAALSRMLLGPVAPQLGTKRLLIVSDGALAYIPFAVLPEPQPAQAATSKAASGTAAPPLVVNHEIVNLPSASVLAVLREQQKGRAPAPKAVAVLADPVFDRRDPRVSSSSVARLAQNNGKAHIEPASLRPPEPLLEASWSSGLLTRSAADVGLSRNGQLSLPRLLFSRQEADAILDVTPPGAGKKAVDFEASRATATSAELSQYRIVHFATHGLLDSVHPELSGLVFSMVDENGRPQNGFLELQDIYNLNLPADLVVLSACETGLGKEISGEGLVGLTRGFMHAGATRVMASLWKVSDAGTATLMANFYTAMEKEHLPPAAALRAAQIRMWEQKRWRDPYYWAAFQIQGEWK